MTYWENIQRFLDDGAIYAKHYCTQPQHSISYEEINSRRGGQYTTPCQSSIHAFVPFYFSPCTGMAFAISKQRVDLKNPQGHTLRKAISDDVVYIVSNTSRYIEANNKFYFTDVPCNTMAPAPRYSDDITQLPTLVNWAAFNEMPFKGVINEITYSGACKYFKNDLSVPHRQNRAKHRMAEFMVKDQIPLQYIDCLVTKTVQIKSLLEGMIRNSGIDIPVHCKPDCYY